MKDNLFSIVGTLALIIVLIPQESNAQIRASERGMVSQTVDGTTIAIDYGRPQARGREQIYGGIIPWGKVWTPGANWATTFTTNNGITLNGHDVAAGDYSVWIQVEEDGWTFILDPEPMRFHLMPPEPSDEQVRFSVDPVEGAHTEILTFEFTGIRQTGAELDFRWGSKVVSFEIGVESSRPLTVTNDVADRHVGEYTLTTMGLFGDAVVPFSVSYENDILVARWPDSPNPNLRETWLIALGQGMYNVAEVKDGELFDIVTDLILEFDPLDGTATSFELRGPGDMLLGAGARN